MADVFPPRDLPGTANDWGRAVENRVVTGETRDDQIDQKVDNGLRAANGQLAVLAGQVTELTLGRVARSNEFADVPFTYTTSSGVPTLRLTTSLALPGAYKQPRAAMLAGSFQIQHISGPGGNIYAEVQLAGNSIWRSASLPVGLGGSVPDGWAGGGDASFFAAFNTGTLLPANLPLTLRLWSVDLTSGTNSRILQNISATVTYSDPISYGA